MISKMKRTTSKAKEEPTPPLYSLPIKNTTFLSRPIRSICNGIKGDWGKVLGNEAGFTKYMVEWLTRDMITIRKRN